MWPIFKNLFISKIRVQRRACWCIQNYDLSKISRGKTDVRSDLKDPVVLRSDFRQKGDQRQWLEHISKVIYNSIFIRTQHTQTHTPLHLFIYKVAFTINESQSKSVHLLPRCWKQERPLLREVGGSAALFHGDLDHGLTECSLYSPEMQHELWAEVGATGRRAGCSTQI